MTHELRSKVKHLYDANIPLIPQEAAEKHRLEQEYSNIYRKIMDMVKENTRQMSQANSNEEKQTLSASIRPQISELHRRQQDIVERLNALSESAVARHMRETRLKYISELEKNYDNILRDIHDSGARMRAYETFDKGLTRAREAYEAIADPEDRREALEMLDAAIAKVKAKPRGGRKSRKSKKTRRVRKTKRTTK